MSDSVAAPGFQASAFLNTCTNVWRKKWLGKLVLVPLKLLLLWPLRTRKTKKKPGLWISKIKVHWKKVTGGPIPKGDVQIALKDADFMKMANGKANGQKLFMSGKLKVKGNLMKATSIESLFKDLGPPPAKL